MFGFISDIRAVIITLAVGLSLATASGLYLKKLYEQSKYEKKEVPKKEKTFDECIQNAITQDDFNKCLTIQKRRK